MERTLREESSCPGFWSHFWSYFVPGGQEKNLWEKQVFTEEKKILRLHEDAVWTVENCHRQPCGWRSWEGGDEKIKMQEGQGPRKQGYEVRPGAESGQLQNTVGLAHVAMQRRAGFQGALQRRVILIWGGLNSFHSCQIFSETSNLTEDPSPFKVYFYSKHWILSLWNTVIYMILICFLLFIKILTFNELQLCTGDSTKFFKCII